MIGGYNLTKYAKKGQQIDWYKLVNNYDNSSEYFWTL